MPQHQTPRILVTGPDKRFPTAWWATRLLARISGLEPIYSTPARPVPSDNIQGIIIGGGSDISPNHYGADEHPRGRYDPDRDAFEMHMLEMALKADLPILGICRGAQLLNVLLGGNLYQDIRPLRKHTPNSWTLLPVKDALIDTGSRLFDYVERARCRINSMHTQAIDRLAPGLVVAARDKDQFIQAVEMPSKRFVVGIQWHPEYLPYLSAQRALLKAFARAANDVPRSLH